jgi:hypothetical protein
MVCKSYCSNVFKIKMEIGELQFEASWAKSQNGDISLNPNYAGVKGGKTVVQGQAGQKHETLSEKQTKTKRIWGMAQVVKHLPSK